MSKHFIPFQADARMRAGWLARVLSAVRWASFRLRRLRRGLSAAGCFGGCTSSSRWRPLSNRLRKLADEVESEISVGPPPPGVPTAGSGKDCTSAYSLTRRDCQSKLAPPAACARSGGHASRAGSIPIHACLYPALPLSCHAAKLCSHLCVTGQGFAGHEFPERLHLFGRAHYFS
jgi:hypothetical protein